MAGVPFPILVSCEYEIVVTRRCTAEPTSGTQDEEPFAECRELEGANPVAVATLDGFLECDPKRSIRTWGSAHRIGSCRALEGVDACGKGHLAAFSAVGPYT